MILQKSEGGVAKDRLRQQAWLAGIRGSRPASRKFIGGARPEGKRSCFKTGNHRREGERDLPSEGETRAGGKKRYEGGGPKKQSMVKLHRAKKKKTPKVALSKEHKRVLSIFPQIHSQSVPRGQAEKGPSVKIVATL